MSIPLRLLLVEDSESDALLVVRQLRAAGYDPQYERVDTEAAMAAALDRQEWDLIISDYNMPHFSGTAALGVVRARGLDVPFIFVSGSIGEDVAVAAMKAGASDYVMKERLKRLAPAIERELREVEARREHRRAQEAVIERTRLAELSADIAVALTQAATLPETLTRCARAVARHLDAAAACIWTVNEGANRLELLASAGVPEAVTRAFARVPLDQSPIGDITRQSEPFYANNAADLGLTPAAWGERDGITALAAYPLFVEERVVGILAAFSQRPLADFVREALGAVADQLALGIERRRAEDELRQSQERFSKVFRASPIGIAISSIGEDRYLDVNDAFLAMIERDRDDVLGRTVTEVGVWQDPSAPAGVLEELRQNGTVRDRDLELRTKHGETRLAMASFEQIELGGRPCLLALVHDLSERRRLEDQLRQSQKMEAVGRLAGGVAHDFNNLLAVITGYCDLLLRKMAPEGDERADIEEIRNAADGASSLTRQLLAFSRRQVVEPRVLDLNDVVAKMERMLKRITGEDIELATHFAPQLPSIRADAGQMEQVLLNLVVNARDAMPTGGRLLIETDAVELDESYGRDHPAERPGKYVMLAVTDTGIGMDAQTQAHIFEPFFTTKEVGEGSGLGLATVYGIVKQSEGFIWVYSEVGTGTTFKVYLPQVDQKADAPVVAVEPTSLQGTEAILVVEDSPQLRSLMREVLEMHGYRVLDASTGRAALEVATQPGTHIDLLLTDVIMPGMNGRELADTLTAKQPGLKVVFASGYTADALTRYGVGTGSGYLQKPFSPKILASKVREILDARP